MHLLMVTDLRDSILVTRKILGLNNDMTIIDSLKRASKVAGFSVQKKGTQKSYPSADDL